MQFLRPTHHSCHWVLDVVFREDDCRIRIGHAAENMGLLRRLAMNLLRREKSDKRGIHVKQLKAALDERYLLAEPLNPSEK